MPAKRALWAALALLLAVSFAAPSGARALSADGFEYTATGGVATVTGCTGTCPATLVIPDTLGGFTVTSIGDDAFYNNQLTTLTIPSSVTSIGYGAFSSNQLTTLTIPSSVTSIGAYAFYSNALTALTIPNTVTSIGDDAFSNNLLTALTIGSGITAISNYAFDHNHLTTLMIPNTVTRVGGAAFAYNRLTAVTIPSSVTSIGAAAFYFNRLTSAIFLGDSPTADVGTSPFTFNAGLAAVTRSNTAAGWEATWGGKPVVIADARATATVKPTATGTATVGSTLTATDGTWTGYPTPTFTYQWYACTTAVSAARTTVPSTCTKITGGTQSTFKLTTSQKNKYVAVLVKGTSLRTTATTWLSTTTAKVR